MENSEGKSGGAEISKKTKSLDIQSLYQSRVPKEGHNKGKNSVGDDEVRKKKRKSRKRVALSSLEQASKKSRSSLDQVCVNGVSAGSGDSDRLLSGLGLKLTSSGGLNGISLNLDGDGNVIRIPKGKRGSVRRKKFENKHVSKASGSSSSVDQIAKLNDDHRKLEGNQVSKTAEPSDSKATSIDQIVKLNSKSKSAGKVVSPKVKQNGGVDDDSKAKRTHKVSSARHARKEGGPLDVSNGDASSRKRRSSHSKRKDLASGSETVAKKVEPSVDNSASICHDFQDDDEENLEQNAARMLSSRFDPSCTGFSQKIRSSESPSANGLSFLSPSDQEFGSRGVNSLACPDSAYADTASRILRPRKRHRDKDLSRKRRHFYEILSNDVDAYWCLNRRIKVFWPLDESWYYGLVNDYDPERKLHHIKYDDRDEEWINLRSERFKLLMLASEVPDTVEPKESAMGDKHTDTERRDLILNDDSYLESHMDSEPIISWLARSSRRVKSSPSGALKKQKISHLSLNFVPPSLCDKTEDACGGEVGLLERGKSKSYALPDTLTDVGRSEKSASKSTTSSKESKFPVVYVRRRFRKKHESKSVTTLGPVVDSFHTSKECDISVGCVDPDELLWSINSAGMLKLTMSTVRCKKFRVELQLPLCPLLEYQFGAEIFWLFRTVLLLQYGTIVTTWPKVQLEVLFVDNIVGLRFFLFEGCLKQVVAFVFLVLTVFLEPNRQGKYVDLQMPVTSIRFKLSSIQDLRKQHVFAYYSFSKLKNSKWLYLDCKLQRHCLLTRQLPLPECTYDNIKALEGGSKQLHTSSVGWDHSLEGLQANSVQGIMPMGVFKEPFRVNWSSVVKHGILPPFALSFTAAPTFFLSLHLKLLMERSIACVSLQDHDTVYTLEHSGKTCMSITDGFTHIECCSENAPENTPESNLGTPLTEAACSGWPSSAKPHPGTDAVVDGDGVKSSQHMQSGKVNVTETSSCSKDSGNTAVDVIVQSKKWEHNDQESEQFVTSPRPLVSKNHASPVMSSAGCCSVLDGMSVEIPPCEQVERNGDAKIQRARQASDLAWNVSDDIVCSPSPTGPGSLWHRSRNGSSSSPLGDSSYVWSDGKTNLLRSGFGNGPKKPRTQVQYALPFRGFDVSSKHKIHNQNGHPYRRIRRANEKRTSDGSRSSQRNLELLACDANVLITDRDKGWRECGARVVLELADQNEWKLAVKVAGSTKYSYKVRHAWQAGSSNRYTHAMMWKVANDWILEFPDRSQWMLFKEMHEECHNRNIRAALVKNIPIPGVRLIEESDDDTTEVPFVHSSPKYFRQVETDVDMAMDPSHILYDMDSEDEKWISQNRKSLHTQESICKEITEELFEKTMDMFEKVAYAQQRDHFTADEMDELMVGVGSMEVIKAIYDHWRQKRQRKGMPLIRQLQAPLWEMYQQQVKEWEQSVTKGNTAPSNGCQDKIPSNEKPPMFAFCLKPRGLEAALNKGSKHRPQRRFHVSGHSHTVLGDQDGLHAFGRRLNGFALGDERVLFPGNNHDSSDTSPLLQVSTRVFSPKDGPGYFSLSSDASEWNHNPKLHRNKSKKNGTFLPPGNSQTVASYNQRTIGKRNGVHRWNMALPEWPSQKHHQPEGSHRHGIEQFGGSDLNEFRLRDASGAAQHALNMAKLKREKAQRLLYRADLAIHKAVVSLMTADAIKASTEESNGDGVDQIK